MRNADAVRPSWRIPQLLQQSVVIAATHAETITVMIEAD